MQSIQNSNKDNKPRKKLNAYSLAGLGISGIIGSGFFLGSAISIKQAGPSVILAFLLCGFLMSQVLGAMTSISINRPVTGSFKVYAEQFMGKYTGFLLGWSVYVSNIFGIGSEAIAAGIFLKYWLPQFSVSMLAVAVIIFVILLNRLNTEKFSIIESGMAALKILAILFFICIGAQFVLSRGITARPYPFASISAFFPNRITGFLQSMLIAVFTMSGVSTVAMATSKVRKPETDIPKATVMLILGVVVPYVVTIFLIISTVSWKSVNMSISPLVQAFKVMGFGWASSIINAAIFIAAFSVMLGTYFGSDQLLISLSNAKEAPQIFKHKTKKGMYQNTWLATGALSLLIIALSFFLSSKLFNYLISACSYFSFFNWIINLIVYLLWLKQRKKEEHFSSPLILGRFGGYISIFLIGVLAVVSLWVKDFRIGFYSAAAIMLIISIAYFIHRRKESNA
ncbi:amino acid permease [Ethanoligenens sp.]|uniref:amino acid permease n=1 Tax=Ethanoligenens sp. TaxID=2099655 RepID=UPI0039EA1903